MTNKLTATLAQILLSKGITMPPKYRRAETEISNPDPKNGERDRRPTSDKIKTFPSDASKRIPDSDHSIENHYDEKIQEQTDAMKGK